MKVIAAWPVPGGWTRTTLAEVRRDDTAAVNPAKHPDERFELYSIPAHETGKPELVNGRDIGSTKKMLSPDTVLLSKINPRINRVWVVGAYSGLRQIGSSEWIAFCPIDGVVPQYLAYYLRQDRFCTYLASNVSGVGGSLMRVKGSVVDPFPFILPPLGEQQRIVDAIDSYLTRLDAAVASLERVQAKLKAYRASVLKAAVEGRLVPTEASLARAEHRDRESGDVLLARILKERRRRWEETELFRLKAARKTPKDDKWTARYEAPAAPDMSTLPEPPEGWCWATGDQLALLITKGASPNWQGFDYCEDGIPFVRSQNVRWGQLDLRDVARLPGRFNDKEKKSILKAKDVLLNLVGASIGRAAVATSEIAGGNCNQAVGIIRLVPDGMIPDFLLVCLLSPEGQRRISEEIVETARANISLEDVRSMAFPMPPIVEQKQIVAELQRHESLIDSAVAAATTNERRCDRLRQAILRWAFEGKLVDQDPHDEPAEELLTRLRAERAVAAETTKSRARTANGAA